MTSKNYKIDYFEEAHKSLCSIGFENYVRQLIPYGKTEGDEYIVQNPTRNDSNPGSFKINISSGKWSDFATGDAGGDLISLTSYIKNTPNLEAVCEIANINPQERKDKVASASHAGSTTLKTNDIVEHTSDISTMEPPAFTNKDTEYFSKKFNCSPSAIYSYKNKLDITVGYIVRWQPSGLEKVTRPFIYDTKKNKWASKFFNPRPLYNLPEILKRADTTVMIVEGEKACEAAKILFPDFVVTTSSGGSSQVRQTQWDALLNELDY